MAPLSSVNATPTPTPNATKGTSSDDLRTYNFSSLPVPIQEYVAARHDLRYHDCQNETGPSSVPPGRKAASMLWDTNTMPGLNNILYIAAQYMYCGMKTTFVLQVPNFVVTNDSGIPLRLVHKPPMVMLSSLIRPVVPPEAVGKDGGMCFSNTFPPQPAPTYCRWATYPDSYAKADYWRARSLIDFYPEYYEVAERFIARQLDDHGRGFLALHIRRADYKPHCEFLVRKKQPPWPTFIYAGLTSLFAQESMRCFATPLTAIVEPIRRVLRENNLRTIFIATNTAKEVQRAQIVEQLGPDVRVVFGWQNTDPYVAVDRPIDVSIVEMIVMSYATAAVLNKFSSFSGNVYEIAAIKGRMKKQRMYTW